MKGVIIDVDMYQKIRELSTIQGMSQRAIAKMLGISRIMKDTVPGT
jgi:DNA-binding transcriptional regulator LsrR (DeoR family)